jgi:hypothetical protein
MSNPGIDHAGSHGLRWQGCRWRWLVLTGAAVFLSASLVAQDTSAQSGNDDSTVNSPPEPMASPALSADRIISVLEQEPEMLAAAKEAVANQLSVDPGTIKDDTVYEQIRQDPKLRARITEELNRRGYDVSSDMDARPATAGRGGLKTGSGQAPPGQDEDMNEPPLSSQPSPSPEVGPPASGRGSLKTSSRQKPESRRSEDEELNEPRMLHRPNPYAKVPSLKDLYSQFPSSETKLKRFGSGVFRYGTGNADDLPMDLPAGPDYVLGPGDGLILTFGAASPSA